MFGCAPPSVDYGIPETVDMLVASCPVAGFSEVAAIEVLLAPAPAGLYGII